MCTNTRRVVVPRGTQEAKKWVVFLWCMARRGGGQTRLAPGAWSINNAARPAGWPSQPSLLPHTTLFRTSSVYLLSVRHADPSSRSTVSYPKQPPLYIQAPSTMAEAEQQRYVPLRLGSIAPNFKADTTKGPIDFHEFIGDNWVVFFSHPEDFTPVCTTELGEFARLEPEFNKRGVKLIGLSANTLGSHEGWIQDIDDVTGSHVNFPIIADKERKVAYLYDM
ncbi:hypothetical protein VTK73DRAFT_4360 [Phialemonium thermophilum]|uniref:Thioredoxin domain-containing protein n=1 Tax=Phialemonium thermophilum TaxID=223376 RepID=A0ABR3VA38_9PEZI